MIVLPQQYVVAHLCSLPLYGYSGVLLHVAWVQGHNWRLITFCLVFHRSPLAQKNSISDWRMIAVLRYNNVSSDWTVIALSMRYIIGCMGYIIRFLSEGTELIQVDYGHGRVVLFIWQWTWMSGRFHPITVRLRGEAVYCRSEEKDMMIEGQVMIEGRDLGPTTWKTFEVRLIWIGVCTFGFVPCLFIL